MKDRLSTAGRLLSAALFGLAALTAAEARAVDVVGSTSAQLVWTAASGPVAGYGVFVAKNGASFPATPSFTVTGTGATVTAAYDDTVMVRVAAYDASGTYGPSSPSSDSIRFVQGSGGGTPIITLSGSSVSASTLQGASPANGSFTLSNTGTGTLSYTVADDQSWLSVTPASGTATSETDTISLVYSTAGLAPGSYGATVTVSGGTGVTPKSLAVNLTVSAPPPAPAISLSTTSLSASAQPGATPAAQSFTVKNSGGGTLAWSASDSASWLSLSPASGTSTGEADSVSASFVTSGLAAGTYTGTITVAGGAGVTPKTIAVSLTIAAAPAISLSTTSLSASAQPGATPAAQSFTVKNSGGGTLAWSASDSASWLSLSPASGTSTGEADSVSASFVTSGLAAGTYTGTITVAGGAGVTPKTIAVSLTIAAAPAISLSTTSLSASAQPGATPAAQSFTVKNSGGGTLAWSASDSASWLSLSPASGTSTGEADSVSASFVTSGLAAGTYTGTITVAGGAGVTPKTIAVSLTIAAAPAISLSTTSITSSTREQTNATSQSFTLKNGGTGTLSWSINESASWLSVSPASGSSKGENNIVKLSFQTASLAAGHYDATITVSGGSGVASKTVAVSLTIVAAAKPAIGLSATTLSAKARLGQSPLPQTFQVRNAGTGTLSWTASDNMSWLALSPANGSSAGENDSVTATFSTAKLQAGTYTGSISVGGGTDVPSATLAVTLIIESGDRGTSAVMVGFGKHGQGKLETREAVAPVASLGELVLGWAGYAAASGETRPVACDVDGDGLDEYVVGTGEQGDGRLEVLDDRQAGFAHLAWLQMTVTPWASAVGETYPACGDLDGDGKDEIVVGGGPGSGGILQIFDDASTGFAPFPNTPLAGGHLAVAWASEGGRSGETHPAVGDLDGDGRGEIIVGFPTGGRILVLDDVQTGFAPMAGPAQAGWIPIPWDAYNQVDGSTWPAAGDIDGDGYDEIVVGFGDHAHGWMIVFDDARMKFRLQPRGNYRTGWIRVKDMAYNKGAVAPTRPALGNVDGDPADEVVVGLGPAAGGKIQILDDASRYMSGLRGTPLSGGLVPLQSSAAASSTSTTWPTVGDR